MQFPSHPVRLFASFAFVFVLALVFPRDRAVFADAAVFRSEAGDVYFLENSYLKREFAVIDGTLRTSAIGNKLDGTTLSPIQCGEFRLRLSKDPDLEGGDVVLTAADFTCASVKTLRHERGVEAVFSLASNEHSLRVELHCLLGDEDLFSRKYLVLTSETEWALERVDVEFMEISNIYQPYQIKAITARAPGQWKPGLGQPLYTRESGTFWGVEFPASENRVDGNLLRCGYLHGRRLTPRKPYTSHRSVVGVSDSAEFVKDAFFEYIDRIRIRPLRLQIQYNSWFDHGGRVSADLFGKSVAFIDRKLVRERGLDPLSACVIDDGWQDTAADWSVDLWKVNDKFDSKFERSRAAVESAGSTLGLWLSPGCLFGAQGAIGSLKAASVDPEVYIVISNGAYLSPWWLQHVDSVWMINAGDAAGGSSRTEELVYRDDRYHELAVVEETQFPLCALFNHEPKKTRGKETKDTFVEDTYVHRMRPDGSMTIEDRYHATRK